MQSTDMKLQLERPLIIFDLEMTGLDLVRDRIIQIAYIKVYPDGKEERFSQLINPGMDISPEATKITHITNEMVAQAPPFIHFAQQLSEAFEGCDFAGFHSNQTDIPMLAEEFLRAHINFDFSQCHLVDVQTIYHKMEPRDLTAAYKFYTGKEMTPDNVGEGHPHDAGFDAEATYQVLCGQLRMYSEECQDDPSRQLPRDVAALSALSRVNDNVDFAGRIVWKPVVDADGNEVKDENGQAVKQEVFNFGKHKGRPVAEVLQRDPGYYNWMLNGEFTYDTKQVLTRIRLRNYHPKPTKKD